MRTLSCTVCFLLFFFPSRSQLPADSISSAGIEATVRFLAADSLKGRGAFTQGLHQAARFISSKFEQSGLATFPGFDSYFLRVPTKRLAAAVKVIDSTVYTKDDMLNVVGVLEGRSRPEEVILFSAHYDGVGMPDGRVHNGANDNASGTAAVVALAEYFSKRGDNGRTIIFCAFAGEELGLLGSAAFVHYLAAGKVVAVINIEMIGRADVGKDAFFVTGEAYSDVAAILARRSKGRARVRREPGGDRKLFQRSDNFPFALKGIPAHTLMSSDDGESCYHQPCDDVTRLDFQHMTRMVQAIAVGTESLISGKDTPSRIKPTRIY